jgi:DME family drug/metabolite transporter
MPAGVASAFVAAGAGLCFVVVAAIAVALHRVAPQVMSIPTRETLTLTANMAPAAWAAALVLAVVSTALAFIVFLNGLAVLGPVRTGIISTVEPFWAALAGALVLQQSLGIETLLGGIAIAAAVLLLQLRSTPAVTTNPRRESVS